MDKKLLSLPIGIQTFEKLRSMGKLYVDKTELLMQLVDDSTRVFLSRPRRFGKSLTLSTLDAMFSGKVELFRGLAAETWVAQQARQPSAVLNFDMSAMDTGDATQLRQSLLESLDRLSRQFHIQLHSKTINGMLQDLILDMFNRDGPVTVLIDEYDKPILDNIGNLEKAKEMRMTLHSFYTVLKSCDKYLRFVMLTGISKFSKMGVFSALNNLRDISMSRQYGDIAGYTQEELERDFSGWIDDSALKMGMVRRDLLQRMRDYYDGFCFDGKVRLYNPFSILNFFSEQEFSNYWYESGSPSFIVAYMRQHGVNEPETYRHIRVTADFVGSQEIERARPESFLYQSGYLTVESKEEQQLTLDYPNREVLNSISRMYLENVYRVEDYAPIGTDLWRALKTGDITEAVRLYNTALAGIPYEDFKRQEEALYKAVFIALLRGAGVEVFGEVQTSRGRPDVLVLFKNRIVVLEFKLARRESEIHRLRREGLNQIEESGYTAPFDNDRRPVTSAVIVINGEKHEATL